jgi:hypothetical protein
MFVVSMVVPLVFVLDRYWLRLGGLDETGRRVPVRYALHQRNFANVVPRAGGILSPSQFRHRSMLELHRSITRGYREGDRQIVPFFRSHRHWCVT